jgi:hypothetical protein
MSHKIIRYCQNCGTECRKVSHNKKSIIYCSLDCKKAILETRILKTITNCSLCNVQIEISRTQRTNFLRTGKAYCSSKCGKSVQMLAFLKEGSEYRKSKEFRLSSSERMKKNNPMWMDGVKEKMIESSKGKTFLSRGGNGQLTKHQMMLHLATGYPMEHPIETATVKHLFKSVPNAYKVDLAVVESKLAIEVDGASHKLKKWKFLDKRKTEILNSLGWTVIRFTNQEVETNLRKCLKTIFKQIETIQSKQLTNVPFQK